MLWANPSFFIVVIPKVLQLKFQSPIIQNIPLNAPTTSGSEWKWGVQVCFKPQSTQFTRFREQICSQSHISLFFKTQNSTSLRQSSIYFPKPIIYSIREKESLGKKAKNTCHSFLINPWKGTRANFSTRLSATDKIKRD